MIGEVMAEAGVAFDSLDRIAVTTGPGTFTGTRIGIAAARALALSTGAETVGVSSLAVMSAVARREVGDRALAVLVDARRGEVYAQAFGPGGASEAISPPELLSLEDASRLGGEGAILFVGSGAEAVAVIAMRRGREAVALLPGLLPDAQALAHIAAKLLPSDVPLTPLYLRPPDAKPQDGKAVARA
jgi:tRNA threonylcarbamoyladenosine biosynthesis protein TsaB